MEEIKALRFRLAEQTRRFLALAKEQGASPEVVRMWEEAVARDEERGYGVPTSGDPT